MLEARALFYAIIVSLLIALMSGALISLAYLQRQQQTDQFEQNKMIRNVNSGIELIKSGAIKDPFINIDLFEKEEDSILIGQLEWGMYDVGF